ncbi:MAG: ROK family protein [Actinomycetota bacterium]
MSGLRGPTGPGAIVAGVDLGGTKIQTVVAKGGEIVGGDRRPTPRTGAEAVTEAVAGGVRAALGDAGVPIEALAAVGIGAPGRTEGGVVSHGPNIPGLQEPFPLGRAVADALGGIPVHVDNDVTVATLGELRRGAGRPFRSLLGVFVGTGVGGGIVIDDEPWLGRGAAAEIGHVNVKPDGRRCGCGGRGHLEAYAGRAGMEAKARRLVDAGKHTVLFDLMAERKRDRMTSGTIARALQQGDEMAAVLIDEAVWALGVALSSAQNLLDVEAIIVGGGLAERFGQPLVDRIAEEMRPRLFVPDQPPAVLAAELGDLSGAVGAVVLAGG